MSTTTPKRAPMTYELISCAAYGYCMAALAGEGPMTSTQLAGYLARRQTPHGGEAGALGVGWYPMSVARIMTQIEKHGYPVRRDPDTGLWTFRPGSYHHADLRRQHAAITECYRLCALDDRPRRPSSGN